MSSRSRASAIVAYDGVTPPSPRLAQSSMRPAPPSCAASAEATEFAATSSSGARSAIGSVRTVRREQRVLLFRVADGVREALLDRPRADVAMLVDREEADLRVLRELGSALEDALDRHAARVLGRMARAHHLDDEEAAAVADDFLADAGRGRAADVVVDVKPGADDRAVADAAVELPRHAARRARAGEIAFRVD